MALPSTPAPVDKKESSSPDDARAGHLPGHLIDRRYRLVNKLGRGGMGAVYLVEDLLNGGRQLALKQIRRDRADPRTVAILKNEFLALSRLRHPNLVTVYDFGFDRHNDEYYFTAEFVRGLQLYRATQGLSLGETKDLRMLLYLFVEILRALEFIHSRGLVHGDLKPENLLVSSSKNPAPEDSSRGVAVKLIDFGLTKKEKDFGGKKIFGTSCYIAPETILGSQVDRRTDLYSLGVVLYHMAVRKLPFSGKSNVLILKGHLEDAPTFPSDVNPGVPRELGEIIVRLMAKKPSDRYASAIGVIEDINRHLSMRFPLETPESMRSYLESPWCVGRRRELGELFSFFNHVYPHCDLDADNGLQLSFGNDPGQDEGTHEVAAFPSGRFFLIRGEERIGKGRIIKEFKDFVEVRDVHYVSVKLEEEGEGTQNLVRFCEHVSKAFAPAASELQTYVLRLLESLATIDGLAGDRLMGALEVLADALVPACKEVPLVLVFTRLENAGEPFLQFLRLLVERIARNDNVLTKIMVIATVREEQMEKVTLRRLLLSPQIRSHFREISLERLSREEFETLLDVTCTPHRFPRDLVHRIFEESDGNPGVVQGIMEHLVSHGRLEHEPGAWAYRGDIENETLPGKMRSELRARIQGLDDDATKLGLAFAFLGNSCELDLAAQISGIAPAKILPTLITLKSARILREDGEGKPDYYSFTQSSAREIFRELASALDRLDIHCKAGTILKARFRAGQEKSPRRLAYHFLRGERAGEGVKYSLLAAADCRAQHLPRRALDALREMRERCPEDDIPSPGDVDFEIAALESTVGDSVLAVGMLRKLLHRHESETFRGDVSRADILIELGSAFRRLGQYRRGGRCLQEAFKELKGEDATASLPRLLTNYARLFHDRGNYLESYRYCDKAIALVDRLDDLTAAQLFLLTAENHYQLNNCLKAMQSCTKALATLDAYQGPGYMGFTFFALGRFSYYKGRLEYASKQFGLAASSFRRTGLETWEARCYQEMGGILLTLREPTAARSILLRASQILERVEYLGELVTTYTLLGEAHRLLGSYEEAEDFLANALKLTGKLGIERKSRDINLSWSRICLDRGSLDRSVEFLESSGTETKSELEEEACSLAKIELQGRIALARGDFRKALDVVARARMRVHDLKNKIPGVANLELGIQVNLRLGRSAEAQKGIKELLDAAREYRLPVEAARASMMSGKVFMIRGEVHSAVEALERALVVFKEKEVERELAELYVELGSALLQRRDHRQASLYLDEGFYLAKKLNLVLLRTRYLHALGRLETLSPEGDATRARGHYRAALRLAKRHGFIDLVWQIRGAHGALLLDRTYFAESARLLDESMALLRGSLERVPEAHHESYSKVNGAVGLKTLLRKARELAGDETVDDPPVEEVIDVSGA